ncbi:4-alpha-glucanotransferase [bacterium C-53]|nr:4-alpha-glucanotransferase [Lachnospiraceae bacterium]NBI02384.1 4-alpha-glucanotransferase [Lachnospiraceae bacterium]RKJ11973.1 4-alpha-glucanotransferase [bacterium C-53]
MRKSGILMPIASLPSAYGIGSFSKEAYEFADRLEEAGQSYWQILPLGPTGYGDSPYQSFSTFAGNPYFIDLEDLVARGYVTKEDCDAYDFGDNEQYIDYEKIYKSRFLLLRKAFQNSHIDQDASFQAFVKENAYWLDDYALYMAVKASFDHVCWVEWDDDIKRRKPEALDAYRNKFRNEVEFYQFQQYMFHVQWEKLKSYVNGKGIKIIGDIPIYVAFDSSDTWANPELFQFDEECNPVAVAGCPPDAFSATGQLWGNPLYRWDYHRESGYEWWMRRLESCFQRYDVVRIDHFRGFDEYYSIPYGNPTAENGTWEQGPGYDIFRVMKEKLGKKEVIAEDLGFLTPSVLKLLKRSGYPGMKVLQFAFDSREESDYLPHNYINNCVVYTGTHDNDTVEGWYQTFARRDKQFCRKYLNLQRRGKEGVHWDFIRAAMASVADTAIIPIQDYLGLGSQARINTPSTLGDNWKWRMKNGDFTQELAVRIREMTKLYGRLR